MFSQVKMGVLANDMGKEQVQAQETGSCRSCFQLASEHFRAALELKQAGLTIVAAWVRQERSTEAQTGLLRN